MKLQSSEEWSNTTVSFFRERALWPNSFFASHSSETVSSSTANKEATRTQSSMKKKRTSNRLTKKLSRTSKSSMDLKVQVPSL